MTLGLDALPMFPLENVMLPGEELPLRIFEPRYVELVRHCLETGEPLFGVVLIAAGREVGGGEARNDVGALARIAEYQESAPGQYVLRCEIGERIRIRNWLDDNPYPVADIDLWPDEEGAAVTDAQIDVVEARVIEVFERVAEARNARLAPEALELSAGITGDATKRLYALGARIPIGPADKYAVLSAPSAAARLTALAEAVDSVVAMIEFQLSEE